MGAATWLGRKFKEIGVRNGWADAGPGGKHPFLMKKAGERTVPIRAKLQNPNEARSILKQMGIPRDQWPENLK